MTFLQRLTESSDNTERLSRFINSNSVELNDYFISQSYSSIYDSYDELSSFILRKFSVIQKLDFSENKNSAFLFCLLDFSERFGLHTEFQQLFNLAKAKSVDVGHRLTAASKFLIGIRRLNDYNTRIDSILENLSESYLIEEDSSEKVICTIIHFYIEVFNNFGRSNKDGVLHFRSDLDSKLSNDNIRYLYPEYLREILQLSIDNIDELYIKVHQRIDSILERKSEPIQFNESEYLIESGTDYATSLQGILPSFQEIRNHCANLYSEVSSDDIFYSLQRGVSILSEENQLLAYMNSYGNMHYAKLKSAFLDLEPIVNQNKYELIDWGCGQGIASICFIEHFSRSNISKLLSSSTLIEPSVIALKRAALHLKKYTNSTEIITINKTLDLLQLDDIKTSSSSIKVQLFSNILDIDFFNMHNLLDLIKNKFETKNIFIIASPYISDQKTQRIDDFVDSFQQYQNFKLLTTKTERKGQWQGTNWSRVIRVFSVEL
jgi:hypothetical protein